MVNFQERKAHLLEAVSAISDEKDLAEWEEAHRKVQERRARMEKYRVKLREKFDPESVRRSREFRKPDKNKVMHLIKEMNVREPIELLISQLTR